MRVPVWVRFGVLVLLLPLAFTGHATEARPRAELKVVKHPIPASDFYLRDLNSKLVRLSDFRGKVVLLNFWATWCPPCRKEMPSMQQLYQAYKDKGLEIVAVSVDTTSPGEVRAFVEELGLTFPVLHDRDSLVSRLYSNPGVPSSYLIDPQGKVAYRVLGEYDWFDENAINVVEKLLP
ncbi:MAG: TlpA disulfide reductase family protein [Gammaproteobacteria bacterium]|nr:MAG: TlpA disulfide reductase family protein [Gammaproteobacteria bacterium]